MSVTKTHPIRSTLKAAIDYICNPEKTDRKLLVSFYGCAAETADIEFAWTRRHAIDKGTNLGRPCRFSLQQNKRRDMPQHIAPFTEKHENDPVHTLLLRLSGSNLYLL